MAEIQSPWVNIPRVDGSGFISGLQAGANIAQNNRRLAFQEEQGRAEVDLQSARQRMLEEAQKFKQEAELGEIETGKQNQQLLGDLLTKWNQNPDFSARLNFLSEPKYSPLLLDKRFQPIINDLTSTATKQYEIQQGTAQAAAITALKSFDVRLQNEFGMLPGSKPGSQQWDLAASKAAINDAGRIAMELGVQNAPMAAIPQLGNGQLDVNTWKSMLQQYRPKAPEGMKPSRVTTDEAGNVTSQTFEQPEAKPIEKLKTENEWVQANMKRFTDMKDADDEPLYKTPQAAAAAARAEYQATQGKAPEKAASDTAAQAERLAKSQGIPFVRTPDERNALKKGTRYVMPNGQVAIKQ